MQYILLNLILSKCQLFYWNESPIIFQLSTTCSIEKGKEVMGNIFNKTFQSFLWICSFMVNYIVCVCKFCFIISILFAHMKNPVKRLHHLSSVIERYGIVLWLSLMPLFCLFPSFIRVNAVLQLVYELQAHVQTNIETFAKTQRRNQKCQAVNFFIYHLPHVCVILSIVLVSLDNGNKLNDMLSL